MAMERIAPFAEFLQAYLDEEDKKPAALARELDLAEVTVVGWLKNVSPGNNYRKKISEVTGYDFERREFETAYAEAASRWDSARRAAYTELAVCSDRVAFLAFLNEHLPRWHLAGLAKFFRFTRTHQTLLGDILRGNSVRAESYLLVLERLPEFVRVVRGECLSIHGPVPDLIQAFVDARRNRGLDQTGAARSMHLSQQAVNMMESRGDQQSHFRDPSMPEKIGRFLAASGVAVLEFSDTPRVHAEPVLTVTPPASALDSESVRESVRAYCKQTKITMTAIAKELGYPEGTFRRWIGGREIPTVVRLRIDAYLKTNAAPPAPPAANQPMPIQKPKANNDNALDVRVTAIEERLRIAGIGDALAGDNELRFLFTAENWRPVSQITAAEVADTVKLVEELRRRLNLCAAVGDDAARAAIRERLASELDELYNTLEAFGREHPLACADLIRQQRRFNEAFHKKGGSQ